MDYGRKHVLKKEVVLLSREKDPQNFTLVKGVRGKGVGGTDASSGRGMANSGSLRNFVLVF